MLAAFALIYPFLMFAQGIQFQELTYAEALAKAKAENKSVFIDCYTSWCGPCKMLSRDVFPQQKAGDYFNPRFVNIKMDMEKGEGPELAKKLNVKAYPTLMVIDGDGEIVVKFAGGYGVDELIKKVEDGQKNSFSAAKKKYESGNMTVTEKIGYLDILSSAYERDAMTKLAAELLANATPKQKFSREFWPLYSNDKIVRIGNPEFDFLVANKKQFKKAAGKKALEEKLFRNYFQVAIGSIYGNFSNGGNVMPIEKLEGYKTSVKELGLKKGKMAVAQLDIAIARINNDAKAMAENIEIVAPLIEKGNIWSYASAFINVFKEKPEAKDLAEVKRVGKFFMDNSADEHKEMYKKMFKLE